MIVAVPVGAYLALPVAAIVNGLFVLPDWKRVVTVDPAQAFGGPWAAISAFRTSSLSTTAVDTRLGRSTV